MTNYFGIIPARFQSSRFPGKPLVKIHGKPMIQRVYEQATKSGLSKVMVATDHNEIADCVLSFGGQVVMTSATHQSGTDRCAEVAEKMGFSPQDIVINIQGDEPFILPQQIQLLCGCFEDEETQISTLIKPIESIEELEKTSVVKVVRNNAQNALYFSRSVVPYAQQISIEDGLEQQLFFKHIGIYAYRVNALLKIAGLPQSMLERTESLEQLRWLANGFVIKTAVTTHETIAIDTPKDLIAAEQFILNHPEFSS